MQAQEHVGAAREGAEHFLVDFLHLPELVFGQAQDRPPAAVVKKSGELTAASLQARPFRLVLTRKQEGFPLAVGNGAHDFLALGLNGFGHGQQVEGHLLVLAVALQHFFHCGNCFAGVIRILEFQQEDEFPNPSPGPWA